MRTNEEMATDEFLKRAACSIVAQLPDDAEDAIAVLNYAREILLNLGSEGWGTANAVRSMVRLVSDRRDARERDGHQ